jgi:hypothetical protein
LGNYLPRPSVEKHPTNPGGEGMRRLHNKERYQRGCDFCIDKVKCKTVANKQVMSRCPYDECPYHELDGINTYDEFLKASSSVGLLKLLDAFG